MKSLPRSAAAAALLAGTIFGSASAQQPYGSPAILPPGNQFQETSYYPSTNLPSAVAQPARQYPQHTYAAPYASPYASPAIAPVGAPMSGGPVFQQAPAPLAKGPVYSQPVHKGAGFASSHLGGKGNPWLSHHGGKLGGGSDCNVHGYCSPWFGGVYGLIMTRDREDHYMFSYDDNNESVQLTDSRDADMSWAGGVDVRFGRYFHCGTKGVEVVYWGLYPGTSSTVTTDADVVGNLNGILNWDQLTYNGATCETFVNNAEAHAVWRDHEVHNVELNLLHFCGHCGAGSCDCSSLQYHWLAGVRYFKFSDHLLFGADTTDGRFTGAADELYYAIDMDNDLVGFQIGAEGEYRVSGRLNFDFGLKLGLYGNHISHRSEIGGAAGLAWINNGPNNNVDFSVENDKTDISMLAELNLGAEYCVSDRWTVTGGYRAVAVTGLGLPTDQIYPDLRGIQDVLLVDSNGSMLLHGAYVGAEFQY